jgi:hypothetical protein
VPTSYSGNPVQSASIIVLCSHFNITHITLDDTVLEIDAMMRECYAYVGRL